MSKIICFIILIGAAMTLSCCTNSSLKPYAGTEPKMDIKDYFNGPVKAWGMVQSRSGEVTRRFEVDMVGSWDGDKGTLKEDFHYYDGKTQQRTWYITKVADDHYEGTASDIIGKAVGKQNGSAIRWTYVMKLDVDNTTYDITFDDWMFRMNDGVLINRSYLKKFGFRVAELTIFMQKQKP